MLLSRNINALFVNTMWLARCVVEMLVNSLSTQTEYDIPGWKFGSSDLRNATCSGSLLAIKMLFADALWE